MDYRTMLEEIGEDNFRRRQVEISEAIEKFLDEAGYPESVICNERILYHVLLDYYTDISRLKDFHGIENTKTDKIMGYLVFWILRRKPIQITDFSEVEKDVFVNERFACNLLIAECLLDKEDKVLTADMEKKFEKYIDLLLYYFKYRQFNPQVIELLIESFKMGREFGK